MKNFKILSEKMHAAAKIVLKWGTVFATILLIFAFFSSAYGIMMCEVSVYLFAESVISALLMDVIDKRIHSK